MGKQEGANRKGTIKGIMREVKLVRPIPGDASHGGDVPEDSEISSSGHTSLSRSPFAVIYFFYLRFTVVGRAVQQVMHSSCISFIRDKL